MANFPKNSMGESDAKNQKLAAGIYIVAFILLHGIALILPEHPNFTGWRIGLFAVAAIATIVLAVSLWNNGDLTEEQRWPHILVTVLAFASAVSIGYCSSC